MKISRITQWRQRLAHPRLTARLFPSPPPSLPPVSPHQENEPEIVDLRDRAEFSPRLFFGHSVKYWTLWLLGAIAMAVWLGPLLAEFTNRFLVKLW